MFFGSAVVFPRLFLLPRDAGLVAVFLFPQRSLGDGDLSRLSSKTGLVGGLMMVDVDVSWVVLVLILLSVSTSLSSLSLLDTTISSAIVPLARGVS